MTNLVSINNKSLQVKEFRSQRVITFKDIDNVHERTDGTAARNFRENKDKFIKGTDYFLVTGDELQELKRTTNFVGSRASEINLITESGYLMLVKSLTDDLAWKVQRELVNNYFRGKELVSGLNNLSPQLQLLINLELGQAEIKQELQGIRDTITLSPDNWRTETNAILNKIGNAEGDYGKPRNEAYEALKIRGKCRPDILISNLQERALYNGMARSKVNKLGLLDVLEHEPRLREIYITIVKEMAIKYKVA